jgi:RNA polymerase sigma-70 factor (ECF subfamily)
MRRQPQELTSRPCDVSHHLLADLEDAQREAFVLTQLQGLSYAEAAEVLECPVGTIRSRVARARAHLLAIASDATESAAGVA